MNRPPLLELPEPELLAAELEPPAEDCPELELTAEVDAAELDEEAPEELAAEVLLADEVAPVEEEVDDVARDPLVDDAKEDEDTWLVLIDDAAEVSDDAVLDELVEGLEVLIDVAAKVDDDAVLELVERAEEEDDAAAWPELLEVADEEDVATLLEALDEDVLAAVAVLFPVAAVVADDVLDEPLLKLEVLEVEMDVEEELDRTPDDVERFPELEEAVTPEELAEEALVAPELEEVPVEPFRDPEDPETAELARLDVPRAPVLIELEERVGVEERLDEP